jgi:hypothetical protein
MDDQDLFGLSVTRRSHRFAHFSFTPFSVFGVGFTVEDGYVHLILMGAVIQMIMGVALWMFPRRKEPPPVTTEPEGMTLYIGFNAGTVIRSLFDPFWQAGTGPYFLAFGGMILQILSLFYFLCLIFQRIRAPSA